MKASKQLALKPNTLYSGDCLDVMREWPDNCVDLIYLDPPFNSKANYNILFGKDNKGRALDELAQFTAFQDTWHYTTPAHDRITAIIGDTQHPVHKSIDGLVRIIPESPMLAYVSYMAERVVEMQRILKDSGSLYLHCDPTASHYLKIALDEIFGKANFQNEIVWHYTGGGRSKKYFSRKHDIIFMYVKNPKINVFNVDAIRIPYKETSGYAKAGITAKSGKHYKPHPKGTPVDDVWNIPIINPLSNERLGYPTQKPLALLERIVEASSAKGDLVLDPFCGCGTAAHASQNLRRNFLGIDISIYALDKICKVRLKDTKNLKVMGLPTSYAAASEMDPFMFEQWAVTRLQGFYPNNKQTGDGGVDGRATLLHKPEGEDGLVIAQVKMGNPSPDAQRALLSKIIGGKASMGVFITLAKINQTPTMREVIRDAGVYQLRGGEKKHPRMRYWSIEEYFNGIEPPLPEMVPTREETQQDLLTGI